MHHITASCKITVWALDESYFGTSAQIRFWEVCSHTLSFLKTMFLGHEMDEMKRSESNRHVVYFKLH